MIFIKKDALTIETGILVHGCNAQGVMGSGFAAQVKKKYPECFKSYTNSISNQTAVLGRVVWYRHNLDLYIGNAITQEYYGRMIGQSKYVYTSYNAIESCFQSVFGLAKSINLNVYIPDMIGCGLGGGDRNTVIDIINRTAAEAEFDTNKIIVCHL